MSDYRTDPNQETTEELIAAILQPTSAVDTLMHVSAQVMALAKIVVSRGVCTEDEFNREFMAAKQTLEEANVDVRKRYLRALKKWSLDHQIKLAELGYEILRPLDPRADVKVLFTPGFPPDPSSMFVRVVADCFEGLDEEGRRALLEPLWTYYSELPDSPPSARFGLVAVTRDELADSAAANEFEAMYQDHCRRQQQPKRKTA
jgi:hypothetical protein